MAHAKAQETKPAGCVPVAMVGSRGVRQTRVRSCWASRSKVTQKDKAFSERSLLFFCVCLRSITEKALDFTGKGSKEEESVPGRC